MIAKTILLAVLLAIAAAACGGGSGSSGGCDFEDRDREGLCPGDEPPPRLRLNGNLLTSLGEPAPGVQICLGYGGGENVGPSCDVTDATGSFAFSAVPGCTAYTPPDFGSCPEGKVGDVCLGLGVETPSESRCFAVANGTTVTAVDVVCNAETRACEPAELVVD